jgi:alpha-D-ribose 1-methylphosphonate 5-triphosphate synthase subunit PhnG
MIFNILSLVKHKYGEAVLRKLGAIKPQKGIRGYYYVVGRDRRKEPFAVGTLQYHDPQIGGEATRLIKPVSGN